MKITKLGLALALAGVVSLGAASSLDAQATEDKPKAEVKSLHEGALTVVDGKIVDIKHITMPPGFVGGKHFHTGDVFVYVLEGEVTVVMENEQVTLPAGKIFQEGPDVVMRAKNLSTSVTAKVVVFQVGDTGKPTSVKVE